MVITRGKERARAGLAVKMFVDFSGSVMTYRFMTG
jgi:hypothetical protein